jgi:hypothetical protein
MTITTGVYTTRETVKRALDIGETARNNRNIDRCIESAARRVDGLCHRIFYPRIETKYFDWPNYQQAVPWRLWLDDTELISVTSITSGGTTIPAANYNLEPNRVGPPYNRLEVDISTSSALSAGSTFQQSIAITGLWGYTADEVAVGTAAEAMDASETGLDIDAATSAEVGVGTIIKIDSERMIVNDRAQLSTGQTLGGTGLTNVKSDVTVPVADGTLFAADEIIKIDSESMLVVDISGNNLTVIRAYDGSVLAAHAIGATIYAPRTLTVARGALGTTAATHLTGATIYEWKAPPGIRQLNTTEAIHEVMQEQTGWFRTMSASSNFGGTAKRSASMDAILDLRDSIYQQYGRKARTRTI